MCDHTHGYCMQVHYLPFISTRTHSNTMVLMLWMWTRTVLSHQRMSEHQLQQFFPHMTITTGQLHPQSGRKGQLMLNTVRPDALQSHYHLKGWCLFVLMRPALATEYTTAN